MQTIQYGWRGRWQNMHGHNTPPDEMQARVDRDNHRDGYERFRIADDSTEGETGAPEQPEFSFVPPSHAEVKELLTLTERQMERMLTPEETRRMNEIIASTRGPIIIQHAATVTTRDVAVGR